MNLYWRLHHLWMEARAEVVAVLIAALFIIQLTYVISGQPAGDLPGTGDTVKVVPATGEQGFNTAVFCQDPLTKVKQIVSPDASGITYELRRVKDGTTETVTVVYAANGATLYAKHFYDTPAGQTSEPAFLDSKAKECIEVKK